MATRETKETVSASPEANIFEQYNATLAQRVVEQLRPLLEKLERPSTGVQQRLFDVDQAATYIGRTPEAVRLLIHRGKLPVTKIDGKVQIDRTALDKIITDATFYQS
jgi:hypothetical protein